MANPRYHAEPDFYERPGETVHLEVDVKPLVFAFPDLPGQLRQPMADSAYTLEEKRAWYVQPCLICGKRLRCEGGVCGYCARAQAADETAAQRARQPIGQAVRIGGMREPWER